MASLKAVLVGGAACSAGLVQAAAARHLPMYLTYGSTEMASQVTTTRQGELLDAPTSVGHVLRHRELYLAPDGEIHVKGATRFTGYVCDGSLTQPFDEEGWFATGDVGRMDDRGGLQILGRKDTMFISGGENIYPEEIEKALIDALQAEACVVVPVADIEFGQRPVAFVKIDGDLPERDALSLNLERFKWPDRLYRWPEQVTSTIKPDRNWFADWATQQIR
jgi:O-succinylbenzoic acid--CoA ligase